MANFVKTTGLVTTNGSATTTHVFGSAPASAPNTIIVRVAVNDTTLTGSSCTDSQGGTYVLDASFQTAVATVYVWRRTNPLSTGSSITVTITAGSTRFWTGVSCEYSGVGTTITSGTSTPGGSSSSPVSATTGASLAAGDLCVGIATSDDNTVAQGISDPPSGGTGSWVSRGVQNDTTTSTGAECADNLTGTGGTQTGSWSISATPTALSNGCLVVGYVSGGGTTTTPVAGAETYVGVAPGLDTKITPAVARSYDRTKSGLLVPSRRIFLPAFRPVFA